jgi:RNA:NAD 2'-phosphotransferase (TPT1/KptA family)
MPRDPIVDTSKLLSYVLRYRPDSIGIVLDAQGWVDVGALLAALQQHGKPVDRALLERVVAGNDKARFAFSADGARHGFPVVLCVDAQRMLADGMPFYLADNGVWLSGAVPPRYLKVLG